MSMWAKCWTNFKQYWEFLFENISRPSRNAIIWFVFRCSIYQPYPRWFHQWTASCTRGPQHPTQGQENCYGNQDQTGLYYGQTMWPGGHFKNVYELLNLRALKILMLYQNHIFQCMGKVFCVEFQRVPLKFHTKNLTHTLKDVDFIQRWKFKSL